MAAAEEEGAAFREFMSAFRSEIREVRGRGERVAKFVPSHASEAAQAQELRARADEIFGLTGGPLALGQGPQAAGEELSDDDDSYDYWPDDLLPGAIAEDEAVQDTTTTTTTQDEESSTTSTAPTEDGSDFDDDDDDDRWPIELLVGA
jgi:hypothetical protein